MNIQQFRYSQGNLAYLLWSGNEAVAIDGGAVREILSFLSDNQLTLKLVTNTHNHDDHTEGNQQLLEHTGAGYIPASDLDEGTPISIGNEAVSIMRTPGHTMDSIVFTYENILITGDTLFNGTVGNCYSKEYRIYFQSLKKLTEFPGESIIYAGHDLVDYATGVMDSIDPGNTYLETYKMKYNRDHVFTTLADELKVNPFIRFNDTGLDSYRESLNLPIETEYERWRAMMTVH